MTKSYYCESTENIGSSTKVINLTTGPQEKGHQHQTLVESLTIKTESYHSFLGHFLRGTFSQTY